MDRKTTLELRTLKWWIVKSITRLLSRYFHRSYRAVQLASDGYAVNDSRNICPVGFRIPTRADFNTLNSFLGTNAGGKLKEAGLSHWASPNTGATNSSGFTGLPGGYMGDAGSSSNITLQGYFWTSTSNGSTNYIRYLRSGDALFTESTAFVLAGGASVRCIKN